MSGSENASDTEVRGNNRRNAGNDGSDGSEEGRGGGRRGGGRGGGGGGGPFKGEELATKALTIQSKRFYLDVKQNDRGRFIKFAEVASGGRKSRVFMSMRTANEFKELLEVFIEHGNGSSGGGEGGGGKSRGDGKGSGEKGGAGSGMIHSETVVADKRRYFFDLRENPRGRFLRMTQSSIIDGSRLSIAVPAEGLKQLSDALSDIIDEFGEGYIDAPPHVELPDSRQMRVENKYFYFDPGHDSRGDYLKISEVKPSMGARQTITVSLRSLPHFVDILQELTTKIHDMRAAEQETANVAAAGAKEGGEGEKQ